MDNKNDQSEGWINFADKQPEFGKDIKGIDPDGNVYYVYLCPCCGTEWRDAISGLGVMVEIVKWLYVPV